MRRLWFSLLFLAGGLAHELRNPVSCQCIAARQPVAASTRKPVRRR